MKSLKKMGAFAALLSAMNFANAEQKEVQFAPTDYEGGEIDKIELVNVADNNGTNTHLLVRSNGKMNGFEMPYAYTGTNTQHFARSAFAQGGATNVDQYIVTDNGKVYMTFKGVEGIYTTQITSKAGPGVVQNDKKDKSGNIVEYAIKKVDVKQDRMAAAILAGAEGSKLTVVDGTDVYSVKADGVYRNGSSSSPFLCDTIDTAESLALVKLADGTKEGFVLGTDANGVKRVFSSRAPNGIKADEISVSADGSELVIRKGSNLKAFNPSQDTQVRDIGNVSAQGGEAIKSVAMSNGIIYYATAKKVGYIR